MTMSDFSEITTSIHIQFQNNEVISMSSLSMWLHVTVKKQ